jgi:hypothetical protein
MSRRENPLTRRVSAWADRAERAVTAAVRGSVVGTLLGWVLRAPPSAFVTVDGDASVAFRVAERLASPADRTLALARRVWTDAVAPYPLRAVSLLLGPVAALQSVREVTAPEPAMAGTLPWAVLLALALVGAFLPLGWESLRATRTGRALAAVLWLPRE